MRNKFKKALAVLASAAMCGSILLHFPNDTFNIDFGLTASAATESAAPETLYVLGTDALTTSSGDGWSYADGTLTLTNATLTAGTGSDSTVDCPIYFKGDLTINIPEGTTSNITCGTDGFGTIYAMTANSGETLTITGGGTLNITNNKTGNFVEASAINVPQYKQGVIIDGVTVNLKSSANTAITAMSISITNGAVVSASSSGANALFGYSGITIDGGSKAYVCASSNYAALSTYYNKSVTVSGGDTVLYAGYTLDSNGLPTATIGSDYAVNKVNEVNFNIDSGTAYLAGLTGIAYSDSKITQTGGLLSQQTGSSGKTITVAGSHTLTEELIVESGKTISFINGGSITNPELLTVADDAVITVDGTEHVHNTDGAASYAYADDSTHTKKTECADCPVGYTTDESEEHSGGTASCTEKAICESCNEAYGAYVHSIGEDGVCTVCGIITINETTFPDPVFRSYIDENFNTSDDDILTADEIAAVTRISVYNKGISDLSGIEYFTALTYLDCSYNALTSLDVSRNTSLEYLDCSYNVLTNLDVSQNTSLKDLRCYGNRLTSLDVSQNTALTYLSCSNNVLTSLDVSNNTELQTLDCYGNQLTELNVSQNTALTYLNCTSNQFWKLDLPENYSGDLHFGAGNTITVADKTLDLSAYGLDAANFSGGTLDEDGILTPDTIPGTVTYTYALANGDTMTKYVKFGVAVNEENFPDEIFRNYVDENFDTADNDILTADEIAAATRIDVYDMGISDLAGVEYFIALERLYCYSNQLTSLDVSQNTALDYLYCYSNQLTSLDVSQNTALRALVCDSNQLTSLDVSKNTALEYLNCSSNKLTELNVSQNTALTDLYCSGNSYNIDLVGGAFDLSALPNGFDVTKVTGWSNATVDGNTLMVSDPTQTVTYTYDLGNGSTETFTLNSVSCTITEDMVSAIENQTYTGTEAEPEMTVVCGFYTLVSDVDYTVTYENNAGVGIASAIITGTGDFYTGEVTVEFTIDPLDISGADITLGDSLTYNGEEQTQTVESITVSGLTLTEDDYTISGNTGRDAGTYTLIIEGKGNYTGTASADWSIAKASLDASDFIFTEPDDLIYDGVGKTADVVYNISHIADWTVKYYDADGNLLEFPPGDAGTYTVKIDVEGNDNCYAAEDITDDSWIFTIEPRDISGADIKLVNDLTYNGEEQATEIILVQVDEIYLSENDYSITGSTGTDAGSYILTITGKGNYTGTASADWSIEKAVPEASHFTFIPPSDLVYDGTAKEAAVTTDAVGMGEITVKYADAGNHYIDSVPTDAGLYKVYINVGEGENYTAAEKIAVNWEFTIEQAPAPEIITPTASEITYGQKLSDSKLSDSAWVWSNPDLIPDVTNDGYDAYMVIEDSLNYDYSEVDGYGSIEEGDIIQRPIPVTVNKAVPEVTVVTPEGEFIEGDQLPVLAFTSVIEGTIKWLTELNKLIAGENELTWQFTPIDGSNYAAVTGTAVIEAKETTTTTTTSTTTTTTASTPDTTTTASSDSSASNTTVTTTTTSKSDTTTTTSKTTTNTTESTSATTKTTTSTTKPTTTTIKTTTSTTKPTTTTTKTTTSTTQPTTTTTKTTTSTTKPTTTTTKTTTSTTKPTTTTTKTTTSTTQPTTTTTKTTTSSTQSTTTTTKTTTSTTQSTTTTTKTTASTTQSTTTTTKTTTSTTKTTTSTTKTTTSTTKTTATTTKTTTSSTQSTTITSKTTTSTTQSTTTTSKTTASTTITTTATSASSTTDTTVTTTDTTVTTTTTTTTTEPVTEGLLGDADNDGDVDLSDAAEVLQFYAEQGAGLDPIFGSSTEEHDLIFPFADVDGDGIISIQDASLILTYYARKGAGLEPDWDELIAEV